MSRSAHLSLEEGEDMVRVEFPYDKAFLERFKAEFSYPMRQWDKDLRCWFVHIDFIETNRRGIGVKDMLRQKFGSVSMSRHLESRLRKPEERSSRDYMTEDGLEQGGWEFGD